MKKSRGVAPSPVIGRNREPWSKLATQTSQISELGLVETLSQCTLWKVFEEDVQYQPQASVCTSIHMGTQTRTNVCIGLERCLGD